MTKFRNLIQKLRANNISSTYFVEQVFTHDVQIYVNTGSCEDGKYFGIKEARVLVDRKLKDAPFFSSELATPCEDSNACDFRFSYSTPDGSRTTTRITLNQSKDKIAYKSTNRALADLMGESYMKVLKGKLSYESFRKAFFTKEVTLDVKNEQGRKIVNYENLLEQMKAARAKRTSSARFLIISRQECVDREDECDFEITYRLGDETLTMLGSLTEDGMKIAGNVVIRPQ